MTTLLSYWPAVVPGLCTLVLLGCAAVWAHRATEHGIDERVADERPHQAEPRAPRHVRTFSFYDQGDGGAA